MTHRWLTTLSAVALVTSLAAGGQLAHVPGSARAEGPAYGTATPAVDRYHDTVRERAPGLETHTVYRPANMNQFERGSVPLVVWANGSCRASNWGYISTLTILASHGFVVVAVGAPDASAADMPGEGQQPERLTAAIDWALDTNNGRQFRGRIDESKVALAGQSCGGVEVFRAAQDPRVASIAAVNHARNTPEDLENVHQPALIVSGGPADAAYARGPVTFAGIDAPTVLVDHYEAGHTGLWFGIRDGEGSTATLSEGSELLTQWLDFTLNDNAAAGQFLVGPDCTLCEVGYPWSVQTKGF